ncbi:hypothetical protein TREMEDRAFT_72491 [Tremella mesenterica DSM 1558]|uniref:uncharacterized protein n=1 Tax=Tremella mesenterica (strain ATCC 24925 / CBS 8224 / DSM 1558 / NBRC 9311 / NRRL Y-6157 / RJB 2259-6 / UBC 559-6) TaxID=578456 RepID=UPI00032C5200|nr:uncharacterized protein TREMEDRAFT_72491 [Tremella mesenterica DSM 1558]EIW65890.1 hypothetical protein TREMEDRAFT_72491 [Tremella mesenterica DSM 1558]
MTTDTLSDTPTAAAKFKTANGDVGGNIGVQGREEEGPITPLALLGKHAKSSSYPNTESPSQGETKRYSMLERGEAGVNGSKGDDDVAAEVTPRPGVVRARSRRSPKSPLLDDEDPGDFEPGEGWAVVTQGRE